MSIKNIISNNLHHSPFSQLIFPPLFLTCFLFFLLLSNFSISQGAVITGGNPQSHKGGTLVYENYEPSHINPLTFRDVGSIEILNRWIFESLLDNDVVTDEYIPLIAQSWEVSKDGKKIKFTINPKAHWFDGKPITVEDIQFSVEVYSRPGVFNPFKKAQLDFIQSMETFKKGEIVFHVKEKNFMNLETLASLIILPKHIYDIADPKKIMDHDGIRFPKGSGPYIVKNWLKGDRAVLERNQQYWGADLPQNKGAYNFDQIIIRYIRDPQVAFESLKKGDIDYMPVRVGNTELWKQAKSDQSVQERIVPLEVASSLQEGYAFIGLNLKNELFADKRVRMAIEMAINRNELIEKSLDGAAVIPKGPLYSTVNFIGKYKPLKYDPLESKKILAEAGWKDTDGDYILDKNGKKFSFTVLAPNPRIEKELLFVQDYLKKVGINMNIRRLEYSTWQQLQDERKFEAVSNGRVRTIREKNVDPFADWYSQNTTKGLRNYYSYNNQKVDELILKGQKELDAKKRKKIFSEVNDLIADDHVLIQYSETKFLSHAVSKRIELPSFKGQAWYPYDLGIKYWSTKK